VTPPTRVADVDWAGLPLLNPADFTHCFVCGPDNPHGFRLRIHREGTDALARFTPAPHLEGYPDRFHGGLVGLLVDEMLVYAGAPHGVWGMTATVNYRLRRPIPVGEEMLLRGTMTTGSARGFRASVAVHLADGTLAAEGAGTCVHYRGPTDRTR
jgi:hypothetical protein